MHPIIEWEALIKLQIMLNSSLRLRTERSAGAWEGNPPRVIRLRRYRAL